MGSSLHNLGASLLHRGELAQARQLFQRAIEHQQTALRTNPRNPNYCRALWNHYRCLAETLLQLGEHAGAARALEDAHGVSTGPGTAIVALMLLRCQQLAAIDSRLSTNERAAKARAYADRAAELLEDAAAAAAVGNNPDEMSLVSRILAMCADPRFRDPRQAVELAKKAVELAPEAGGNWSALGVAQYRTGAWEEAIQALSRSVELTSGGSPVDWLFLAMGQWQNGHKNQARPWYDKAVNEMDKNESQDEDLQRSCTRPRLCWA